MNPMVDPLPEDTDLKFGLLPVDGLALRRRIEALEAAIREHRAQKADDRCVEDDDRLYAALGDGVPCDRRVGCRAAMLANCERFIRNRTEGGGPWLSYAELEADRDSHRVAADELRAAVRAAVQAVPLQFWVAEDGGVALTQAGSLPLSVARLAEAVTTYRRAAAELQAQVDRVQGLALAAGAVL